MDDKIGKVFKKTILALILEAESLILALVGISATFALSKKKFVLTINYPSPENLTSIYSLLCSFLTLYDSVVIGVLFMNRKRKTRKPINLKLKPIKKSMITDNKKYFGDANSDAKKTEFFSKMY